MRFHLYRDRLVLPGLFLVIALSIVVGCNKSSRLSVSGNVSFDGQPLKTGQIVFEPTSTGRIGIAQIVDGLYKMPSEQGPTEGKYVVRITANRPTGKNVQSGHGNDARTQVAQYEQFIPGKYNDQSQLTTEVGKDGASPSDFALVSK